ncbi:MAG TPA: hypothetical protein VF535_11735 [Allosphingosinicella sp.]|jgi:hypothetical protein
MTGGLDRREERAGPGIVAVHLWLAVLILAGLAQLYFVLQVKDFVDPANASGLAIFRLALVSVALRIFVLGVGLYFFATRRSPASLYGLIAALLFYNPIAELLTRPISDYIVFEELRFRLFPIPGLPEIAVNLAVIAYLLLSPRVNALYGLDTRQRLSTGLPQLWNRLRGRAPINS